MFKELKKIFFILILFLTVSCTKKGTEDSSAKIFSPLTPLQLIERGKQIFQLNCVSCHGADPLKEGPVGPSIAGSALELVEARVMRVQYPAEYKPKRTTHLMVALPHLKKEIPALHAYLNSVK